MSFSVRFMGTPAKVVEALNAAAATMSGQSLAEYEEAKPAIIALVGQNVGPLVDVEANGHAMFTDGQKTYGSVTVSIKPLYGNFVG